MKEPTNVTPEDARAANRDLELGNIVPISTSNSTEIEIENLSVVKEKKIEWLWRNVISLGKITLFAGEPGVGKSQLLTYIAAIQSNGDKFHYEFNNCQASKVLLISGEDNADDTLKPRFMALGANLSNIDFVKGIKKLDKLGNPYYDSICLIEHIAALEEQIKKNKYSLIIVDPISVYLGSIDEYKNKDIRSALNIISALAERHNLAFVINSHFSKPSGSAPKNAIYRVMGSIGFAAAARIVYGVMKDPEDPERRLFLPIKNNIGDDRIGYVFKIVGKIVNNDIETSRIEWLPEKIDRTANDVLNPDQSNSSPKIETAKLFLLDILRFGSMRVSEIRQKAKEQEISVGTLYNAKAALNILETDSVGQYNAKIWMLS